MPFTKEHLANLNRFRTILLGIALAMQKAAPSTAEKSLWKGLENSIRKIGMYFIPAEVLAQKGASKVLGLRQRVYQFAEEKTPRGRRIRIVGVKEAIELPMRHVFYGKRLTVRGIATLVHELSHFPKPVAALAKFAKKYNLTLEQAEELLADAMAARAMKLMGFKDSTIIREFYGRRMLFPQIDYFKMIRAAMKIPKEVYKNLAKIRRPLTRAEAERIRKLIEKRRAEKRKRLGIFRMPMPKRRIQAA
ncbi:MAG: hypothetical protein DRO04_02945 [Candidatus Iainarchaeum archaeon]|uniref:Uncharacterized protein n=1 Tax=Candidatus Iainarchaeum sp. TaxID=3101447 RepID=A0A497JFX6_9ARCH|nr:MAG: hypothetical protein DRO04_02945 [Candidatus Diapherotrites archaeon]